MISQKKILIVNDIGGSGGAEKILTHFSEFLSNQFFQFDIYLGSEGVLVKNLSKYANVMYPKKKAIFQKLSLFINVLNLVRKKKYDFIILNSLFSQILCSPFSIFFRSKIIWYQHNIQTNFFRRFFMIIWFKFFGHSMIAVSSAVKKSYTPYIDEDRIHILHNGIYSLNKFDEEHKNNFKQEMGLNENNKVIISISRITFYKGLHVLINAFMSIIDDDLRLLIVGDSGESAKDVSYKNKLLKIANLDSRIHFLGWREDIDMLLNISDIFIAPAVKPDPFPTTILEAMSIGKCCIVSEIGGQPEAIDTKSGIVFEANRPNLLKKKIKDIIYDDKKIREYEINSKARYERNFTFDNYQTKLSSIMNVILK